MLHVLRRTDLVRILLWALCDLMVVMLVEKWRKRK